MVYNVCIEHLEFSGNWPKVISLFLGLSLEQYFFTESIIVESPRKWYFSLKLSIWCLKVSSNVIVYVIHSEMWSSSNVYRLQYISYTYKHSWITIEKRYIFKHNRISISCMVQIQFFSLIRVTFTSFLLSFIYGCWLKWRRAPVLQQQRYRIIFLYQRVVVIEGTIIEYCWSELKQRVEKYRY